MRRTLIRGLQYLLTGTDLNGQSSASPIIFDAELRRKAENFGIPLSARLIYSLLVMFLLNEEEVLDDFTIDQFNPGILAIPDLLQTETNIRIAKMALEQESWLAKFCVACELYGQENLADK